MTKDEFGKLFTFIVVVINSISILFNGFSHWISSFFSGCMLIINLIGFVSSYILTSEPINWNYLFEGMKNAFGFWEITIMGFLLAVVIFTYIEFRENKHY